MSDVISLLNYDSSFFTIAIDGVIQPKAGLGSDISDRIMNFELTEEVGKGITGSISLYDTDELDYTYLLKMGTKVNISWGYKNLDQSQKIYTQSQNAKEIFIPGLQSRFTKAWIREPSGGGSNNGLLTFNCSFLGIDGLGFSNNMYQRTTKSGVVNQVLTRMLPGSANVVKFRRGSDTVNGDTAIRQDSVSDFRFLNQMALEWRCLFRIAQNGSGQSIGLFCDYDDDASIEAFFGQTMGSSGISKLMEYKRGKANVLSYTWSHSDSENGSGDNAQIRMVNGQPQIFRTVATTEGVQVYQLDVGRIRSEFAERAGNSSQITAHMSQMLKNQTMEELVAKKYYYPVNQTTAPQGAGFTVSAEVIGDPTCTAPARIKFGEGFPSVFRSLTKSGTKNPIVFFAQSVSHKIDRSGYKMSVKIADCFSTSGGTLQGGG